MNTFTYYDSGGNQTRKTKRRLGWLTFCAVLLIGQIGFAQLTYCTPTGAGNNGDEILNFTLSNLSNNSTPSEGTGGYSDYSSSVTPANLQIGVPYVASLVSGPGTGNHGAAIWIDYNQDGVFDESEKVAFIGNTIQPNTTVSFPSFAVPASTPLGTYRLRVQYRWNQDGANFDPCTITTSFAETEDYSVEILSAPTCMPPAELTATNITATEATLDWTSDGTLFDVIWGESGFDIDDEGTSVLGVSNPYTVTGLSPITTYQFYVRRDCDSDGVSLWTGPFSFETPCAALTPPTVTQTFDGFTGAAPATLACWSEATGALDSPLTGTTSTWMNQNYNFNYDNTGGSNGTAAYINLYGTDNEWLISPQIDLGDGTTLYQLEFDVSITPWTGTAPLTDIGEKFVKVVVSTDGGETWATTNVIQTYDNNNIPGDGGLTEYIPLMGYSGIVKIAFFAYSTTFTPDTRFYIDNFRVMEAPDCPYVTDVTSSNVTGSTAELSWTGIGVSYDIEWGEAGFPPTGTPDISNITTSSYILGSGTGENLLPITTYHYYIRQNCGTDGYGNWAGPYSFTTPCAALTPPTATQTFDGFTGVAPATLPCWSEATGALDSPLTGTTSTWMNQNYNLNYDATGGSNGTAAYINLWGADSEWLISPEIDLGDGTTLYQLEFDVSITPWTGTAPLTDIGEKFVKVVVSTDGGDTWTTTNVIQTYDNNNIPGDGGLTEYIPLMGYSGIVKIAFFAYSTTTTIDTRFYIDNFRVMEAPDCPYVTNVTSSNATASSVELSWTGTGDSFDIEWGEAGFIPDGTPDISGITTSSYVLGSGTGEDLLPVTTYHYYIRQNCGTDGYGNWAGPYSFTTPCAPLTPPTATQTFDGFTGAAPATLACWSEATGALDSPLTGTTSTWMNQNYNFNYDNTGGSNGTAAYINLYGTDNEWLISPQIDLGDGTTLYQLEFDVSITPWTGTTPLTDIGEKFVKVVVSTDGGETWATTNVIQTYDNNNIPGDGGLTEYIPLIGYSGIVKIAFFAYSTTFTPDTRFYIDNFRVMEAPDCPYVTNVTSSNATASSVELSWTGIGVSYDIEYGEAGFIPDGTPDTSGITTSSYVLGSGTGENLLSATNYQYYIRQNCGTDGYGNWAGPFSFTTTQIPVTLDYEEGFEGVHNWILSNGTQTNQWVVGEATANGGTHSLYISNDNGVTNGYTINSASTVHAYRDVQIPTDAESVLLSFDWKSGGEGATFFYDYFRVWVVPATYTPVPGTQITVANSGGVQFGDHFLLQPNWTNQWFEIPSIDYAGQIVRLVFEWRNDTSLGTQPGAAIDNVEVSVVVCAAPTGLAVNNLTTTSADLSWASSGTSFNIQYGNVGFTLGSGLGIINDETSPFTLENLTPHTSYEFYVQQDCGTDGVSAWSGPHFFHTGHCVPVSTNTSDYISSFTTTGGLPYDINNTGSGMSPGGYGNFGSMSVSHYETGSVDFTIVNSPAMGTNIWIDWNNNLEFEESEKVFASGATGATFSGTITVPFGTPEGDYRMRVRSQWNNSNPDPCNTITYGEAEDYTFTVIEAPSCLPPFNPIAINASATSASLEWQANGDLFDIEWGEAGFTQGSADGTIITGVTNPYTLSGLTAGTTYEFYVRQDCGAEDGLSMWNGPVSFTPGFFEGDIPTLLNANPSVEDIACANSFSIEVPEGQFLASLHVEYIMTSSSPSLDSHQRSVLYSPSLEMGEPQVVSHPNPQDFPGIGVYNRTVDFANGATGTIEFQLKAWRTELGGADCSTNEVYVESGSWILTPTFEDIPTCPDPAENLDYTNVTEDSVDLIWTSDESGTFQILWGEVGFDIETEGTTVSDINTFSHTLSNLDSTIAYEFYVRRDCSDADEEDYGEWVGPVRFNSGHCIPYSSQGVHNFIVFNTSGAADPSQNITYTNPSPSPTDTGYINSTNLAVISNAGESFDFTSNHISGAHGLRIWVDWNNDLVFGDDEIVFEGSSTNGQNSGTIEIPEDILPGDYRMRIRGQQSATSTPPACGAIPLGEAIDFTLSIPCDEVLDIPVGNPEQDFVEGDTLADLDVTGDNLVWFADEDLTIELEDDTLLTDNTTYYVVSTYGSCQSDALAITVSEVLSRTDFDSFGFRYYPNPVKDMLYLSADTSISDVTVINMLGQQISVPSNSDNTSLDMSELPTGNYLIKVTIEGVSKMFKIVKN